ncbi:MAG TPA: hypothetical protein VFT13_11610, partial [Candidatus Krumholzibacteria bacterium]|nr:hypothetical protein [Candidatus Krumholzibacteria bacterium]
AGPARGQAFSLSADPQGLSCADVTAPPGSVVDLYVLLSTGSNPVTAVQFRVRSPACPGISLVEWTLSGAFIAIGDPESGVAISAMGCMSGEPMELLRLRYLIAGTAACCEIELVPHPQAETGRLEVYDCNFTARPAAAWASSGFLSTSAGECAYSPPPRDPVPADGSSGVPAGLQSLDWDVDGPHSGCQLPLGIVELRELYFGTDPNPPLFWTPNEPWYGPLYLAAETTYYWRIVVDNFGYLAEGPVWSFTTENAIAAESKTWGAVKALYR